MNAAETNGATTSFILQHLRIVSGIIDLPKLRDDLEAAVVVEDNDLEAGPPQLAEAAEEETNVLKFLEDYFNRAARNSIGERALSSMPTFPANIYVTLPGLLCLAQIRWQQVAPLGFPSPAIHKWYIVCVTSLLLEFVASFAQWIISATGGPQRAEDSETYPIHIAARCLCRSLVLQ